MKLVHHDGHRVVGRERHGGLEHQLLGAVHAVELAAEQDLAYLVEIDDAEQFAPFIDHSKVERLAGRYGLHHLSQIHIGLEAWPLLVDDGVEGHEGEDGAVLVVRDELALACQTHGVDAVGLEGMDGQIRGHGNNHQRDEQGVAARQFGDEEDARQRGMEYAAHHAGHAQQGVVRLGHMEAERLVDVPHL